MALYAIIRAGGKQYKVSPGDTIDVERLDAQPGSEIDLTDVLLVERDGQVLIGQPSLDGARVRAEVREVFRGPKIIVFKYKPKKRYRRKSGHRQWYTRLLIKDILVGEVSPSDAPPQAETDATGR
ncbi:50S ribosomal protein L21 [bacterium HR23]|nr:50S ribosomal protein L21 [bacterium HR23]